MKLQFKNQKFQSDAAKAVTDSFVGQRNQEMQDYTLDLGQIKGASYDAFGATGFRNVMPVCHVFCHGGVWHGFCISKGRDLLTLVT